MSSLLTRRRQLRVLCLLWAGLLVYLALQPDRVVDLVLPHTILRSLAHLAAYGFMTFLLCLHLRFRRHFFHVFMTDQNACLLAFFLTALWGGWTEILQYFTRDRYADWNDLAWDAAGAALGTVVFYLFRKGSHEQG